MRTPRAIGILAGVLAIGLAPGACVVTPQDAACDEACSLASRCGLLPSALGGSIDEGRDDNEVDCIARCLASDGRAPAVVGLLEVLTDDALDVNEQLPLCTRSGTNACEELIEELEETPETSELEVTTTLQVSMVSAISHASKFEPESWCCFSFEGELLGGENEGGMMMPGTDRPPSEIAAIHEMFEPTRTCFDEVEGSLATALELLMPEPEGEEPPPEPDPMALTEACTAVGDRWLPPGDQGSEMDEPDLVEDPCYFARKSTALRRLDISGAASSCSVEALQPVEMALKDLEKSWRLEDGDILFSGGGVRSIDEIEDAIELEIRDEITRPGGFVTDVCEELDDEAGGDACALPDDSLDPEVCEYGPPCSEADCLLESPGCDRTLCDEEVSPPGRDCGYFGIESVTLGYRSDEGVEVLGDPILGCASLSEVSTVFPDVKVGIVTPIAIVTGILPTAFLPPDGELGGGDGSFRWLVEGDPRWLSAGSAQIQIPSPLLEHNAYRYENPLEYLGWVLPRVPLGQGCDDQPRLCESLSNENCEDGLDNDGDGFADGASPWCDELFYELIERCVVTELGRQPRVDCMDAQ